MTAVPADRPPLWTDPVYGRVPLPPVASGVLLALALLCVLLGLAWATDSFARLAEQEGNLWQVRDGRLAVLLAILAGTVPTALRLHEIGTRRSLATLARSDLWDGRPPAVLNRATAASAGRALVIGASGFLVMPLIALSVDRDPMLYLTSHYWGFAQVWTWVVGTFVTVTGGVLTYRVYVDARTFAALARALPRVDLLDTALLTPFAQQGLRSAVPGVISVTFLALNLGDDDFLVSVLLLGGLVLLQNVATLLIPVRGLHDRLREEKLAELQRVNAAIRGDAGALAGSPLSRSDTAPSLADLLAWRTFVQSVSEWPIDFSTLSRFALYVGLPLISWVGAAMVERMLDAAIG